MKKTQSYTAHVQEGILLNANENTKGLSAEIRAEIAEAVSGVALNRYPDNSESELLEAYAKVIGVTKDDLLAGNVSDQMLGYLIGSFLGKGKKLYTLSPDFSMYDYYAASYEADVFRFKCEEDGSFDLAAFIAFGKENGADMIMFSNPNNPTGHLLSLPAIEQILQAFADIPVVIDEAYIEFSGSDSSVSLIRKYANLYVTRTLSKAWGLAGIRTGFLVSSASNMEPLKKNFVPYALNSVSMKIASTVLKHAAEIAAMTQQTIAERERMYTFVKECKKAQFFPSAANFLYGRSSEKEQLIASLKEKNIVIRDYAGSPYFRITVGTEEENEIVCSVLKQFEEAL